MRRDFGKSLRGLRIICCEVESLDRKMRARADELAWRRAANRGRSNRAWEWMVGAVFVIAIILTGYGLVQTRQHLETRQSELENANQATDQAKAQATELAKRVASLNSELEKAYAQRNELQTKLEEATSEITSAQSELEDKQSLQSELENASRRQIRQKRRLRSSRNTPPVSTLHSRKQTLNVMSFSPNWIRPPQSSNQPNPSLKTSSLV